MTSPPGPDSQPAEESAAPEIPLNWNARTRTLGGVQFWGDVQFFHGWHIQRNVFTGHYRLLDDSDVRHAWGTLEQCRAKLEQIRRRDKLAPMSGTAVVLVHGLGRSDKSLRHLKQHLQQQGYLVFGFNYPSLRCSLEEAADHLHQTIDSLQGVEKIHIVAFSMGGLVTRAYLDAHHDSRIERLVLAGTPNLGADLATMLHRNWAFKLVIGPAGQQLVTGPNGAGATLPTPKIEFGVIAGAKGTERGYLPLFPGDNDSVVSVASTRLPGAVDFAQVRSLHTFLMEQPETLDYVTRFLKDGRFRAEGPRQPILGPPEPAGQSPAILPPLPMLPADPVE